MKRTDVERLGTMGRLATGVPIANPRVTSGEVLWTLTRGNSTAQARRWSTASGLELELHIWSGPRIRGEEDLSWVQIFPTEALLAAMALAKKRQLEDAGWVEQIEGFAL
jgi:hypothetical protein